MIRSFRHKGLRRLFEQADARGIPSHLARKIGNVLSFLRAAATPDEAAPLPGLRLYRLKGDQEEFWSITVSGNWRIIFRFDKGDAYDVDFVDYH